MDILSYIQTLSTNCCGGGGGGCVNISSVDIPYVITQSGDYCVTGTLVASSIDPIIRISASNVHLDLQGNTLNGNAVAADGILVDPGLENIIIENGSVTGVNGANSENAGVRVGELNQASVGFVSINSVTSDSNTPRGFNIYNCTDYNLVACNASSNTAQGVYIDGDISRGIIIGASNASPSQFNNNGNDGIRARDSAGFSNTNAQIKLLWCSASNNGRYGIELSDMWAIVRECSAPVDSFLNNYAADIGGTNVTMSFQGNQNFVGHLTTLDTIFTGRSVIDVSGNS